MADTQARRDPNRIPSLIGVDNISFEDTQTVAVNSDHEMLVSANVTVSGLATAVTDGEAVDAADTGNLALGTDGSNYQILLTDSSGRLTVNPISGQAGVAAGAGTVGATVQRMTLASDDPAVTSLQIMDDWDETDRAKVNIIVGQAG